MSNTFFRFRNFTVNQDRCAMKVSTDACLFGAWVSYELRDSNIQSLVDIGTGTGVLSLMVAQETSVRIDAVEIDLHAFRQAGENFRASPWKERLKVFHTSIQSHNTGYQYDCILSNPPFFRNDLKAVSHEKNIALHGIELSFEELLQSVVRLLKPGGEFFILCPFHRFENFESLALMNRLHVSKKIIVRQSPRHNPFRCMYKLINAERQLASSVDEIIIKNENEEYSEPFTALLRDYYVFEKTFLKNDNHGMGI